MSDQPAQQWRTRLRTELLDARKQRDTVRVAALRSALSAIDNAETPANVTVDASPSGVIAHSATGLGAADVPRRDLTDAEIRNLLLAEIAERDSAAEQFDAFGESQRSAELKAETAVLTGLLTRS